MTPTRRLTETCTHCQARPAVGSWNGRAICSRCVKRAWASATQRECDTRRRYTQFGIAVKQGRFQATRIEYDAQGRSTVTPLTPWTDAKTAWAAKDAARRAARKH